MVMELNKETFKKTLEENKLVIVDFGAPWCGPCQMMGPIFEETGKDYEGRIVFAKVNTDEGADIATENGVQGIPCLIVFQDGKEVDRMVGLQPKEALKEKLDSFLN